MSRIIKLAVVLVVAVSVPPQPPRARPKTVAAPAIDAVLPLDIAWLIARNGPGLECRPAQLASGPAVQAESDRKAPIGLGEAVETTAGEMPARWVIHAATMELGGPTSADIIRRATAATLWKAEELGARSLALVLPEQPTQRAPQVVVFLRQPYPPE